MYPDDQPSPRAYVLPTRESNLALFSALSTPSQSNGRPRLPPELIFKILEFRSRWILLSQLILPHPIEGIPTKEKIPQILLRTPPFTAKSLRLFRRIVFYFRSNKRCNGLTWTWCELSVVKNVQGSEGDVRMVAKRTKTLIGHRQEKQHSSCYVFSLAWTDDVFKDLEVGDHVELFARKNFAACEEEATVEIWGLDDLLPATNDVVGLDATTSED